jgi:endo-1,4-beta-xylanase
MGFSAGAELSAPAGVLYEDWDKKNNDPSDPLAGISSRPDFVVHVYPASRPGTVRSAPGAGPYPIAIAENSLFPIPKDAPPAFLVCTDDDPSHVTATVKLYLELQANKIPAEMHIYAYGEHGFAIRPTKKPGAPVETWTARLKDWLAYREISR